MGKVTDLMHGEGKNYVFPFFWQHGESEAKLREYMGVIQRANIQAVCIESRPHPDFCGETWWRDMDIILDEARRRKMKIWILDDSHFPTGYANGAVREAPMELRRQSVYCHCFPLKNASRPFKCNLKRMFRDIPSTPMGKAMGAYNGNFKSHFEDDKVLSVSALLQGDSLPQKVTWRIDQGTLVVSLPKDSVKLYVTFLTRNAGIHRSYINMLDRASCRILIDTVYEPHWARYKDDFGTVIAGFFSDEPEIGNGVYFKTENQLGQAQDLPWSREVEENLPAILGDGWEEKLPCLWENDLDERQTAAVRYRYMDLVTRLAEEDFSKQIGQWCEAHGVEYIGHIIEDNNAHARLGSSMGHYYRGLSGQHMAGIDDIGGQVYPQEEDMPAKGMRKLLGGRDGEFYHYALGKLGSSCAAIDPKKKGRCMCEIFGAYGWSEGVRLEKFLADHFLVRGVNRFVPHAFSPKKYPDPDCPPHFYANGHNPQYRHFGALMAYMNRMCALLSDGRAVVDTAILYHGDCEWAAACMLMQKPARVLYENQVDFHFIPCDVFAQREKYRTTMRQGLCVNGNVYHKLIVPYSPCIPTVLADAIPELIQNGCDVIFVQNYPKRVSDGADCPEAVKKASVADLGQLPKLVNREAVISPANARLHIYHYKGEEEVYVLMNEDDRPYAGTLTLPAIEQCYRYDAWDNQAYVQPMEQLPGQSSLPIHIKGNDSMVLVVGSNEQAQPPFDVSAPAVKLTGWKKVSCKAIDYPNFSQWEDCPVFQDEGKQHKRFSGWFAYETTIDLTQIPDYRETSRVMLQITDAGETAEVFVNEKEAGIQVSRPFQFEITPFLQHGTNTIRIHVATTLERERSLLPSKCAPIGITGEVRLLLDNERLD